MRTVGRITSGRANGSIGRAQTASFFRQAKGMPFLILFVCSIVCGCKNSQTVWSSEAKSPDGKMIATARAFANGGFGVSGVPATFVYLNWTAGSQEPTEILCLGDESDASDDVEVGMSWLTPTRLELKYRGNRQSIDFQAIKFAGVDISARDVSSPKGSSSSLHEQ